jgi:outer membrane protein assembly factor BamB
VTDNYIYLASDDGSVRVYEINDSNKGHPEPIPVDNTTALNGTIKASPVVTTNTGLRYTERVYITLNNATGGCYWYNFDTRHAQFSGTEGFWVPTGSGYTMQGIAVADNWLTFGNDNKKVFAATGF